MPYREKAEMAKNNFYKRSNICPKCVLETISLNGPAGNDDKSACAGALKKGGRCKISLGHHLHVKCGNCGWRGAMEDACVELAVYEELESLSDTTDALARPANKSVQVLKAFPSYAIVAIISIVIFRLFVGL